MQSLERSAMRSLITVVFFIAIALVCEGFDITLQHGILHGEEEENNVINLKIMRNESETMMTSILYASTSLTMQQSSSVIEQNGDKNKVSTESIVYTDFNYDDDTSLTVTITRKIFNDPAGEIIDCFEFDDDTQWFGGPQHRYQYWPVQDMVFEEEPYLPTHPQNMAITERYWLSSKGIFIYVNETSPLFLDQNNYRDKHLCLIAKKKAPYQHEDFELVYTIGIFPDPKAAHQYAVKNFLGRPQKYPDEQMIRYPIWSTWARYKVNVSEKVVESYADQIKANGFKNSQIEIDDNWETCYGSAEFDLVKFPNISALVERLKTEKGINRVTLWIHPFINQECKPAYDNALEKSYFVKNTNGSVKMTWWQGKEAAAIDFTNPAAVTWWVERLEKLLSLGIDSFKFDAGEVSWLPQVPKLNGSLDVQPGIYTKQYVNTLATNFNDSIEVRVGWRSQELPIFVRMIDKDSRWTWNNGLPTLITTLLQMNLNGYVYVLPDMIGGNGYLDGSLNGTEFPSKELFIRWLQANVFMPSLQYSFVPWDYDNETIKICKRYTEMHDQYTEEILCAMKEAIDKGTPVNPPIWWLDPTDTEAHKINDEYLLGEDILVAPIVERSLTKRDIYLPSGEWKDMNKENTIYMGPGWLKDYSVPIDILPYFKKIKN
ncbi:myogenesis-regulating glycosidase [Pogonomyrmex barbatus]|uniref:Myogenesis-regulating glycosidase n=1 Tax=Pogonomyrmex barbatus TaxID=144034 RepID=A0A6I9WRF2_9HYME|nr:myogenesis-regulating glycosidase [Pogonomyrmex barbatus]